METVRLVECPRDAMQGWKNFIPTEKKIAYINSLLKVGFDTIDFGSFVSPKAIPQMADTKEVLAGLHLEKSATRLLAIIANVRGAEEAAAHEKITYLGFPFSISSTFQKRNTNSSLEESLQRVEQIMGICSKRGKQLVVYLSMAFGNPYGDEYNNDVLLKWAGEMAGMGIRIISLADTVGIATPQQVSDALTNLIPQYPGISFGVHLHTTPANWETKLAAALDAGCMRMDGALKGFGGCPMAQDDLVGNMDSELAIKYLQEKNLLQGINHEALQESIVLASEIFT